MGIKILIADLTHHLIAPNKLAPSSFAPSKSCNQTEQLHQIQQSSQTILSTNKLNLKFHFSIKTATRNHVITYPFFSFFQKRSQLHTSTVDPFSNTRANSNSLTSFQGFMAHIPYQYITLLQSRVLQFHENQPLAQLSIVEVSEKQAQVHFGISNNLVFPLHRSNKNLWKMRLIYMILI